MPTHNVELNEHEEGFIAAGIASGRFSTASDVIHEALQLLEQRETGEHSGAAWLRKSIQEGLDEIERGEAMQFASEDEFAGHIEMLAAEVAGETEIERVSG